MTSSPLSARYAIAAPYNLAADSAVPSSGRKGIDVTNPGLRASDADRERVVAALERHTAAGRLTLDEFGQRAGRVFAAATLGELAAVTSDLPPLPGAGSQHRQLAIAFGIALLTLVLLGVLLTALR